MQVMKYGFFLIVGIAAQACGGGSDGDGGGGGDEDDTGGSSSGSSGSGGKGGATGNGGSSSGKGGSSSGTTGNGGSSSGTTGTGGSSSGTTGIGGTAGTSGGCTSGQVNLFDVPECAEFYDCIFDAACAQAGAQQQVCVDIIKQGILSSACYPAGTDVATACEMTKADPQIAATYPQCV